MTAAPYPSVQWGQGGTTWGGAVRDGPGSRSASSAVAVQHQPELQACSASRPGLLAHTASTPRACTFCAGTWQQYLCAPESALLAVADNVSDEAAAQFFVSQLRLQTVFA